MAKYTRTTPGGSASGESWTGMKNVVRGASEAPRVHGLTGQKHTKTPRFKNHYLVKFQYTEELKPLFYGRDAKQLIDVTHRVRSIDAPRVEIETETLNQYNKPRITPTKINYQPVTIAFWDDRSDISTNFWVQTYSYYFSNGRRQGTTQYSYQDSDLTHTETNGISAMLGYDHYGYNLKGKVNKKNLFQYISLYFLQNGFASRIDLINPYMQSVQHDQFSQEASNELANINVTWGYENLVYYPQRNIKGDNNLFSILDGDATIFDWIGEEVSVSSSPFSNDFDRPKDSVPNPGEAGGATSDTVNAASFAELGQISANAVARPRGPLSGYVSVETNADWLPASGVSKSNVSGWVNPNTGELVVPTGDFTANPTDGADIDAIASKTGGSFPLPGLNNQTAYPVTGSSVADRIAKSPYGNAVFPQGGQINTWVNPNTGQRVVPSRVNSTIQSPTLQTLTNQWNALTPSQQQAELKARAQRLEKAQNDRNS